MSMFAKGRKVISEKVFVERFTGLVVLKIKKDQGFDKEMTRKEAEKRVDTANENGINLDSFYMFKSVEKFVHLSVHLFK